MHIYRKPATRAAAAASRRGGRRARSAPRRLAEYTQFAIQDSGLFGPNPWKILAPPSNYLSKRSCSGQRNPWKKVL